MTDPDNEGVNEIGEVLDLTKSEADENARPLTVFDTPEYDPAPEREKIRGIIALTLILLLVGTVLLSFLSLWLEWVTAKDLESLLKLVLAPIVALAGSAIGFYFGGKSGS